MRIYASFYNSKTGLWSLIFKDDYDESWYVKIPNVGSQEDAVRIARLYNSDEDAR